MNCSECGKHFNRRYNLKRHMATLHEFNQEGKGYTDEENDSLDELETEDEMPSDTSDVEDMSGESDGDTEGSDVDPTDGIIELAEKIVDKTRPSFCELVEKYMQDQGLEERKAEDKAERVMLRDRRQMFLKEYKRILLTWFKLRKSKLHKDIIETIKNYQNVQGYDIKEAVKKTIMKRQYAFDNLLSNQDLSESEASEDEELQ